jgi:hypothetical protein
VASLSHNHPIPPQKLFSPPETANSNGISHGSILLNPAVLGLCHITRTGTIKNTDQQLVALPLFSANITITHELTDGFVGYYDEKCEIKN